MKGCPDCEARKKHEKERLRVYYIKNRERINNRMKKYYHDYVKGHPKV